MKPAELGRLLNHLAHRLRGRAETVTAIENALRAAAALQGRELKKANIKNRGLCLVMAIILEALQQNFSPDANEPAPDQEPLPAEASN